jgi:hypothetical protein
MMVEIKTAGYIIVRGAESVLEISVEAIGRQSTERRTGDFVSWTAFFPGPVIRFCIGPGSRKAANLQATGNPFNPDPESGQRPAGQEDLKTSRLF